MQTPHESKRRLRRRGGPEETYLRQRHELARLRRAACDLPGRCRGHLDRRIVPLEGDRRPRRPLPPRRRTRRHAPPGSGGIVAGTRDHCIGRDQRGSRACDGKPPRGIAMQTLVLVLLDATSGGPQPLSALVGNTGPLDEAGLVIGLVTIALMGGILPESTAIGPISPMSLAIVVYFVLGMAAINRARQRPAVWTTAQDLPPSGAQGQRSYKNSSTGAVLGVFVLASIVTLVAGVALEQSGNELADDLGMNGVIFGATILAAVTALPEVSSGIQAVRLGSTGLAMSDIYGGNAMQLTFFLLADLLAGRPVLPTASAQSLWLGALGAVVTACYIFGLLARREKKVLGLGPDSLVVLLTYIGGVVLLTYVPG